MKEIEKLLRDKGIRPTPIRISLLALLKQYRRAYTNADLERAFNHSLDRITLYRNLLILTEAGLIRKHIDARGNSSYFCIPNEVTLPAVSAAETTLPADFPHFKCSNCEAVVALPELPEAYLAQIRLYHLNNLRLLAEGTCDSCRHEEQAQS